MSSRERSRFRSAGRLHGRLAILLNGALTVCAAAHGLWQPSPIWFAFAGLLAAATGLQVWDRDLWLLGRRRSESESGGDDAWVSRSLHDLCDELRLPLRVMGEIGEHLAEMDAASQQSAGRVLREESDRLVDVLERWGREEQSENSDANPVATASDVLERVVRGHAPMMEALGVRVRVLTGHRDESPAEPHALGQAMECLLTASLGHLPREGELQVRTHEVSGLWTLTAWGGEPGDNRLAGEVLEKARGALGDSARIWADPDTSCGFGLSLGRALARIRPRGAKSGRSMAEAAA